jgi:hypothetical protein
LFDIAKENGVNLLTALEIDKGRKAEFAVMKAKDDGKKEAYNHAPNRTLSDLQGVNISNPEDFTDEEVIKRANEHRLPEEWFDENDDPNFKVIPKKHHKHWK